MYRVTISKSYVDLSIEFESMNDAGEFIWSVLNYSTDKSIKCEVTFVEKKEVELYDLG